MAVVRRFLSWKFFFITIIASKLRSTSHSFISNTPDLWSFTFFQGIPVILFNSTFARFQLNHISLTQITNQPST